MALARTHIEGAAPERTLRSVEPVVAMVETPSPGTPGARPPLAIDPIYREHAPFIARVVFRLLGDGAHVDDIVQETFIVAARRLSSFEGRSDIRTWLYAIAANQCKNARRTKGRFERLRDRFKSQPPPAAEASRPDQALEQRQAAQMVAAALQALPCAQREVVALYELEELEGAEIAELLGIPVGTVWTRLHHGRKKLKRYMDKHWGSPAT